VTMLEGLLIVGVERYRWGRNAPRWRLSRPKSDAADGDLPQESIYEGRRH
jgi:hypothetical protein